MALPPDGGALTAPPSSAGSPPGVDVDDIPDIGPLPEFLNKGQIASWGNDQFWLFPNLSIQLWARNFYITYTYWPDAVDSHTYEIDLYFVPPTVSSQRVAQEMAVETVIEFAMQDINTIEATQLG